MPEETQTILGGGDAAVTTEPQVNGDPAPAPAAGGSDAAFDYSTLVDSQGFFGENWKNSLPEELRNEACLDNVKNFATLAKSYVNSQKMIGRNKIALPGENATEAELNEFYSALGRPAESKDYKTDNIELPEGIGLDDSAVAEFRETAFAMGLSQEAFEKALAFDVARTAKARAEAIAAHNHEYDETMAKLKAQYGNDLPGRIAQVDKALSTFGIKDIFVEKGLTNNYAIFEALANIGARISESRLKEGDLPQKFTSPQQRIDEIYGDPNGPIYKMDHPKHDETVAEVKRLMAQINNS